MPRSWPPGVENVSDPHASGDDVGCAIAAGGGYRGLACEGPGAALVERANGDARPGLGDARLPGAGSLIRWQPQQRASAKPVHDGEGLAGRAGHEEERGHGRENYFVL